MPQTCGTFNCQNCPYLKTKVLKLGCLEILKVKHITLGAVMAKLVSPVRGCEGGKNYLINHLVQGFTANKPVLQEIENT